MYFLAIVSDNRSLETIEDLLQNNPSFLDELGIAFFLVFLAVFLLYLISNLNEVFSTYRGKNEP